MADIITFGPFKYADSKYVTIIPVPGQEPFKKIHSLLLEKKITSGLSVGWLERKLFKKKISNNKE